MYARLHLIKYIYFLKKRMTIFVEKLNRLPYTIKTQQYNQYQNLGKTVLIQAITKQ